VIFGSVGSLMPNGSSLFQDFFTSMITTPRPRLKFYSLQNLDQLPQLNRIPDDVRFKMQVVANVLPFRTNSYVVEELIDWDCIPDDPMYQLTFPQPGMLGSNHFSRMVTALERAANGQRLNSNNMAELSKNLEVRAVAEQIRRELNPHPQGQLQYNVPKLDAEIVPGVQHKYQETALVFPSAGQTCHAYCSFCFRWAQFVGMPDLKLATDEGMRFQDYLRQHREITDVLFTGGDPMVMRADVLQRYIEPLLSPECSHIRTIRIGTKSLAYWPSRFLTDTDSDDVMRLFENISQSNKHVALMAHFNHEKELSTPNAARAIRRLVSAGVVIRTQSPLICHINDDSRIWSRMWEEQVRLGCIPYYFFMERDTGAQNYFKVSMPRALEIYRGAIKGVSGLARTARGPVMSALPGKVTVDGTATIAGQEVYVLSFLQGRDPDWCKRPFFAQYNPNAHWLTDLKPAFGENEFFYESGLREILRNRSAASAEKGPEVVPELVRISHDAPVHAF
jgi:KamA family protein